MLLCTQYIVGERCRAFISHSPFQAQWPRIQQYLCLYQISLLAIFFPLLNCLSWTCCIRFTFLSFGGVTLVKSLPYIKLHQGTVIHSMASLDHSFRDQFLPHSLSDWGLDISFHQQELRPHVLLISNDLLDHASQRWNLGLIESIRILPLSSMKSGLHLIYTVRGPFVASTKLNST